VLSSFPCRISLGAFLVAKSYSGYIQAFSAFVLWGVFPLYWKFLQNVPSLEVIFHRILWSLVTLVILIHFFRQWDRVVELVRDRRRLMLCTLAAILISINWFVFIWAVQNGHVVEGSLGYFVNPLLTVLLAVVLFRESIGGLQWVGIALAFGGVGIMTWATGVFPWIAFALATSFALYSAAKKKTTMPAVSGLGMETAILAPISLVGMFYYHKTGQSGAFQDLSTVGLLLLGGPITTLPLVLFASAAKSVPLVVLGMLQYIGPTIQFLLAYLFFREPISSGRMAGFVFVWIGLATFVCGTVLAEKKRKQQLA
jgi:chloramphenicol-sensitive protein RarD